MTRISATNRKSLEFGLSNKIVIDTFSADGWTKSGSGTTGTWSVDSTDIYSGRNTLKLITAGTGTGSRDYASKIPSPIFKFDWDKHMVFELIAKVKDISNATRLLLDLYFEGSGSTNYYEITFEGTGNKWGLNNEYQIFRATLHQSFNSKVVGSCVKSIRLQVSDCGNPITVNFAELSYYTMPKRAYLVFTNDDGTKSGYNFMHSVMQPLGLVGSFFPSAENVISGQGGNSNYMNHADVLQLEADGFEVGVHGESGSIGKTGTTISFDAATKQIRDSANGLLTAGFLANQYIYVTGSTKNNGKYTITNAAAGAVTVLESLVNESAGATVALSSDGFEHYTSEQQLSDYIDYQKNYFINTIGVTSLMSTCAYPNGAIGKDSSSIPYAVCKNKFNICRVTHQSNTETLIPPDYFRIHAGYKMYWQSANSKDIINASIANLITTGGIGIIVSHDIKNSASDSYNYNLADATEIMNYISTLVSAGKLQVIKLGDIDKIAPIRTVATHRVAATHRVGI